MLPKRSARNLANISPLLIDPLVGIIGSIDDIRRRAGGPQFHHIASKACDTSVFVGQANFNHNGGASNNRDIAIAKAIGEGVERYCSAIYDVESLPLFAYNSSKEACVAPEVFALHSNFQYNQNGFPFVTFNRDTPVRWCEGIDLSTNLPIFVPAVMVYSPYLYYQGTGDSPICQNISTGLACHLNKYKSLLSGFLEVIERDSFTLTWQAMCSPPQVRLETLSDANYALIESIERSPSCKVFLLDITMDTGVPTIVATLKFENEGPAFALAASTDLSPENAVRKALEELAHTYRYCSRVMGYPELEEEPGFDNIKTQAQHLQFHANSKNLGASNFLFDSDERKDFDEIKDLSSGDDKKDLSSLVNKINKMGYQCIGIDLTTADIEQTGLSITRSVIPGFNPLFMGHSLRSLDGKRLWSVPQKMGYKGISKETGDNSFPHPFP